MRINLLLHKGGALNREQWLGAAEAVALQPGADLSFIGFHPPFVKQDLRRIRDFSIGGLLGMLGRRDYSEFAMSLGIPSLSIHGGRPFAGIPQVGTDDRAVGLMAAEHLARPGVVSFGFFGLPDHRASRGRWAGFAVGLRRNGLRASRFVPARWGRPARRVVLSRIIPWESALCAWLEALPKPAAIFCVDDFRAYWISGICGRMGFRVPEDVMILGAGDDEGYALAVNPNISSVRIAFRREGFLAARALMDWAGKGRRPPPAHYLAPEGVAERASTDILRVDNPHVVKAVRMIRERHGIGLCVEDVARSSGVCRKVLERLFRIHMRATILGEIRREQIKHTKNRLLATNCAIEDLVEECGFTSLNHLAREFKKRTGISPGAFRKQALPAAQS